MRLSKKLSFILRHNSQSISIDMDEYGWVFVDELCNKLNINFKELENIVKTNNKNRFRFNSTKSKIKANQGHSLNIKNDMEIIKDILPLYHGTKVEYLESILKDGIKSMNRQHVHLSKDTETAKIVSDRRSGKSIILEIDTERMLNDGEEIYISENGVYLIDYIKPIYIKPHE